MVLKKDVQTGSCYACRVGDYVVAVKILRENLRQGWHAINLATRKEIRILTAQRLRWPLTEAEARAFGKQLPQIAEIRHKMLQSSRPPAKVAVIGCPDSLNAAMAIAAGLSTVGMLDDEEM